MLAGVGTASTENGADAEQGNELPVKLGRFPDRQGGKFGRRPVHQDINAGRLEPRDG